MEREVNERGERGGGRLTKEGKRELNEKRKRVETIVKGRANEREVRSEVNKR